MWAFAYNTTAPMNCFEDGNGLQRCVSNSQGAFDFLPTAVPTDYLYPPHSYNLDNTVACMNTTQPLANWLNQRGVACMDWATCWEGSAATKNTTNDSTTRDFFESIIAKPAERGATAIGMDECGELEGPKWGHSSSRGR